MIDLLEKENVLKVLQILEKTLQEVNIDVQSFSPEDGVIDSIVKIKGVTFACQYVKSVNIYNVGALDRFIAEMKLFTALPILVLTDKLSPRVLSYFLDKDIYFVDAAGNCFIQSPAFFIHIEGRKNSTLPGLKKSVSLFKGSAAIRIMFALLNSPTLIQEPIRIIAMESKASVGSVQNVIDGLVSENYVVVDEDIRHLKLKKELLDRWVLAYNEILKPRLFIGHVYFRYPENEKKWFQMSLPDTTVWGGENAAYLYDGYIHPADYTLYTSGSINQLIRYGFQPSEEGQIAVYHKFWSSEIDQKTPILLTYADLMGSGISRNIEAAQRILHHELHYFE